MRTEFLCISVLRVASGPRVKLSSSKSALNPAVVNSTDRSKAVVPVLVLRGMFEMNCLLSSSSISTWGTIKTNTYLYRAIQYLHNGV